MYVEVLTGEKELVNEAKEILEVRWYKSESLISFVLVALSTNSKWKNLLEVLGHGLSDSILNYLPLLTGIKNALIYVC
jgi:hypothetical protein